MTKESLGQAISDLYNKHHHTLTDDLKAVLLETMQVIESNGNITSVAVRLHYFVQKEIRYFQMGLTAPKDLVDLARLIAKSQLDLFIGRQITNKCPH